MHLKCKIIIMCLLITNFVNAQETSLKGDEYRIKAGFIYNFINFTEWPEHSFDSTDNNLIICVISDKPLTNAFKNLENKKIKGRKIIVKQCDKYINNTISDNTLNNDLVPEVCHVIFIGSKNKKFTMKILDLLRGKPVLTIGETRKFARTGGMISLFPLSKRFRFEVNLVAVQKSKLKLSSQILMSAEDIIKDANK